MIIKESEITKSWQKDDIKTLVSICCVTYNHEKFIKQTLDSFLMQKTNFPFEIVIDDDASTDNTAKIIRDYANSYPQIISANLRKNNVGGFENVTYCMKRSQGKYIAYCDGDDYWTDVNKLQYQLDAMKRNPQCNMSFHPVERFSENNTYIQTIAHYADKETIFTTSAIIRSINCPASSFLFKKKVLSQHFSLLESIPLMDFFIQILSSLDGGVLYLNKKMSVYSINLSGISTTRYMDYIKTKKHLSDSMNAIKLVDKYLKYQYHDDFMFICFRSISSMIKNRFFTISERMELFEQFKPYLSETYQIKCQELFIELLMTQRSKEQKEQVLTQEEIELITDASLHILKSDIKLGNSLLEIVYNSRDAQMLTKSAVSETAVQMQFSANTEEAVMQNWPRKENKPLVSIFCITYNHEKFIVEAIEGFLNQKTDFPFEIVISDDHSSDSTAKIIQFYAERFPNIIKAKLRKENIGSQKNSFQTIKSTRGKYIALCEGDDYWTDDLKLQYQINEMKKYPDCDISFHPVIFLNNTEQSNEAFLSLAEKNPNKFSIDNNKLIAYRHNDKERLYIKDEEIIKDNLFDMPTPSLIITQRLVSNFPDFYEKAPATDFIIQTYGLLRGGALYLPKVMAVYRKHPKSITASRDPNPDKELQFHLKNFEIYAAMNRDLKPRFEDVFCSVISGQWERIMKLKTYTFHELLDLFPLYIKYLDDEQNDLFLSTLGSIAKKNNINEIQNLNTKQIDLLRDIAVQTEEKDINLAYRLMYIAHKARSTGPFIKKKLEEYQTKINT